MPRLLFHYLVFYFIYSIVQYFSSNLTTLNSKFLLWKISLKIFTYLFIQEYVSDLYFSKYSDIFRTDLWL